MPSLNLQLSPNGPLVTVLVGASVPRFEGGGNVPNRYRLRSSMTDEQAKRFEMQFNAKDEAQDGRAVQDTSNDEF